MAQLLQFAGATIGGIIGGPIGAAVGGLAGGILGSFLFQPQKSRPLVPDMQLAASSYGHPRPRIYGRWRLPGTIFWETEIETREHTIGKGFGGGATAFSYWQSAAFGFGVGPARLLKVWLDGNLFLDNTSTNPHQLTRYRFALREYRGSPDQMPDPLIADWVRQHVIPAEACPAYRRTFYLVAQQIDLAHHGNRMPNVTALWTSVLDDDVVYRQFTPLDDDVSADTSIKSVAVDWERGQVFHLANDGTVRVYDMETGACIAARTWASLQTSAAFTATKSPGLLDLLPATIAVGANGSVYLATGVFRAPYIWTLDAVTLEIVGQVIPTGWSVAAWYGLLSVVPFTTLTIDGVADLLVGWWNHGSAIIINPATGATSGPLPIYWNGLLSEIRILVGKLDQFTGARDIWFVNGSRFDAGKGLYIYRAVVTGDDPSAIVTGGDFLAGEYAPLGSLTAADFGAATPGTWVPNPAVIYDSSDDTLIISSYGATIKWSADDGVIWTTGSELLTDGDYHQKANWQVTRGIFADVNGPASWYVTDVASGVSTNATGSGHGGYVVGRTYSYDSIANAIVYSGTGGLWIAFLQRVPEDPFPVADILAGECEIAGYTAADYDVSLVTDTVVGYGVVDARSPGQNILDVCRAFHIDVVESDDRLVFVPQGQASVATITQDDLGSIDDGDQSRYWVPKRAQEPELPARINLRFVDPALDYQPNAVGDNRTALPVPTMFSKRVNSFDLNMALDAVDARHMVENWLHTLWARRTTFQTALGWKFLYLDPADNVTVTLDDGSTHVVRIERHEFGGDMRMRLDLASEHIAIHTASTTPGPAVGFTPQVVTPSPVPTLLQVNVPLLQDSDDLGGAASRVYFFALLDAAAPAGASAALYQSTTAGGDYSRFAASAGFSRWGRAINALGDTVAVYTMDRVNTLTITMATGSAPPVSATWADLMDGANGCLVGAEILQYQTVVQNADGTVTLSDLLRGRRGTEWAVRDHQAGETFLMLGSGLVSPARLALSEINATEYYGLVPSGRFIDDVRTRAWAWTGADLRPYVPVRLKRELDGSDLDLSWTRQTRMGGLLMDGTDTVPLNEASEAYEAYVVADADAFDDLDPTDSGTYVRAFTGLSSAAATYTAAQMATDGFTEATDTLHLAVCQVSATVGRGFMARASLAPG